MRVLHVISKIDPKCGGTVAVLGGLTAAQNAAGLDVRIVSTVDPTRNDRTLVDKLQAIGIDVQTIGPAKGRLLRHPDLAGAVACMAGDADVVHSHGLWEEASHQGPRAARTLGKPCVLTPHGMLAPWSLAQGWWHKKLFLMLRVRKNLERATVLHFTAEPEYRLTEPLQIRTPALIEPNGIDLDEFETLPRRGAFRQRFPQIGERPVVLFLGRLHKVKGLDLLIPAFAKFGVGDAMLVLAGPDLDGHRKLFEPMIRELGLEDRVVFTGLLPGRERIEAMVDADLFVLPSYQENFGIVAVEALAAGTPVIVSDQVNIYDQIAAGGVGLIVPTQADALADAMARAMTDSAWRQDVIRRARPFVWERFGWEAIGRRWAEHYQHIVAGALDQLPRPRAC